MLTAISKGDIATLHRLLVMHVGVNFTQDGLTPIHLAVEKGYSDIVQIMIHHGADFRMKNAEGKTPLDIALAKKSLSGQQKYFLMQTNHISQSQARKKLGV